MSTNHAVLWLDHTEAHIIHFTVDSSQTEHVRTTSDRPHLHVKSGHAGSGRAPENTRYFEAVTTALHDSREILLMGPGNEKDEFMKYVSKHHRDLSLRIVATLAADHPTDPQLLAFARKYFVKVDGMNGDPVAALRHGD